MKYFLKPLFLIILLSCLVGASLFFCKIRKERSELCQLGPSSTYDSFIASVSLGRLPESFLTQESLDEAFFANIKKSIDDKKGANQEKIPRIIHQFWLFNEPPSEEVLYAIQTVKKYNPDYKHVLWTKEKLKKHIEKDFGVYTEHLDKDIIAISDYMAASVLYKFGGVIIDPWCECVASLDLIFHNPKDLFVGVEPPAEKLLSGERRIFCSPALIGAIPSHPLIRKWKSELYTRLASFSNPMQDGWNKSDSHARMLWISVDSLTDLLVQTSFLPVGPTWWCPIRPQETVWFYRRIRGQSPHRSCIRKIQETTHIGLPLFSNIQSETILVHLAGGRLGMNGKRVKEIFHTNPYKD